MRRHPWETTAVGPAASWPSSLKQAVRTLLDCRLPMCLAWGGQNLQFFNDAYLPILGDKQAQALGQDARVTWAEIWPLMAPRWERAWQGEPVGEDKLELVLQRHGYPEHCWFKYSYSPVYDESHRVAGVLVTLVETTEAVMAERRQAFQLALADILRRETEAGPLLRETGRHVSRFSSGAAAIYATVDPASQAATIREQWRDGAPDGEPGRTVPLEMLAFGRAAQLLRGETVCVADLAADAETPGRDAWLAQGIAAGIVVPLMDGGRLDAVMALHAPHAQHWQAAEIHLMEDGARRTWEALRRIRAEQALRDETRTLELMRRATEKLASTLDLEPLMQAITDAATQLTGAEFGSFFYNNTDGNGDAYLLYTLSGAPREAFQNFGQPRPTKVFGPTFYGSVPIRTDDITKDPRYGHNPPHHGQPEGHLPVVSYLALPVKGRSGEVIGGLFFGHPQPGRFKERHEHLMEAIAGQAAIAMDNARLFREAQREIEQRIRAEEALKGLNETLESRVVEEIERRADAEEALRQAQKMETIGQLSGGIAHDFNNLLQIIHGNLTILQRSLPAEQTKWQRSVANALTGTDRAAALTQRLLAFSRRQPLDPRPLDVNEMIGEMIELLHRTLGETIEIGTRLDRDIPNALVDSNQLENAVLNLAINARDAMPEGGRLEIETGVAEISANSSPADRDVQPGRYVRVAVRDTGTGMSPDVLSRAVEPFFSTKEVGQGTGLGLSMVYGFAKQSGGYLKLSSTEGKGTTAELFVPCATGAADTRNERVQQSRLPQGRGESVLVCEDDSDVRRFSSDALGELGYEVIEASNAQSALQALDHGKIDLLFTDLVLPGGITGAELAEQARQLQPNLKLLFTTGYARTALDDDRQVSADAEVLAKPFSIDDLAVRLRKLLD